MDSINSYAIVTYVAGPIARFAERLRREMDPGCPHRAHVTILPPRPLLGSPSQATEFARHLVAQFETFDLELGAVEQFASTQVIYLAVTKGTAELVTMHDVLNTGPLGQREVNSYVPHITLGQQLPPGAFDQALETARRRWEAFGPPPRLRVDAVTFVQQRADGIWTDLAELGLRHHVPAIR